MEKQLEQYTQDALRTDLDEHGYVQAAGRLADIKIARLMHIGIGLVTEAAEFVDQLKKHVYYGRPLDEVNLKEELGDITWYQRLGVDQMETTLAEILDRNVAKLKIRYPQKFTEHNAEHRDLDAERAVLA